MNTKTSEPYSLKAENAELYGSTYQTDIFIVTAEHVGV